MYRIKKVDCVWDKFVPQNRETTYEI